MAGPKLLRVVGPLAVLLAWSTASLAGWLPEYVLPTPWHLLRCCWGFVTGTGWQHAYAGQFWRHAVPSITRVGTGFLLASALGVISGILCAENRFVAMTLDPLVQLIRAVPGITWLPIAIVWFGIGTMTTVFLIALAAFFPVYISTLHGVSAIPTTWLHAARTLGATRRQVIWRVTIPAAWPSIRSGLRLAMGISWAYVVLGELTGVDRGLGAMIMDARMMGDIPVILVGMVFIAILGRLSDLLLMYLTGLPWRRVE